MVIEWVLNKILIEFHKIYIRNMYVYNSNTEKITSSTWISMSTNLSKIKIY